jgi:hypothetical protein
MDDIWISRTDKLLSDYPSKLISHSVSPFGFYFLGNKKKSDQNYGLNSLI